MAVLGISSKQARTTTSWHAENRLFQATQRRRHDGRLAQLASTECKDGWTTVPRNEPKHPNAKELALKQ
eukprot:150738-Pleurochrysis_carterae.AAC.2